MPRLSIRDCRLFTTGFNRYPRSVATKLGKWTVAVLLASIVSGRAADIATSDFVATNWRNEEGLPHSIINAIVQTRDGYLWIGTHVGLVRFDGVRFVHYSSSNVPELEAGRISCLFEDRDGTLWVALESGRLLAWKDGAARIHVAGNAAKPLTVVAMAQDAAGTIWVQVGSGQFGRLTDTGIESLASAGQTLTKSSRALVIDSLGQLWVGTSQGLKLWRDGKLSIPQGLESLMKGAVEAAAVAKDGAVWTFRNHQLWKISEKGVLAQVNVPDELDGVAAILETSDGRVWLGAGRGNLFYREPGGEWREVEKSAFAGLNRVLYEDHEGNLWRGSFGGGLARIRPRLFKLHELPEASLDRYARAVCADGAGNIWCLLNGQSLSSLSTSNDTPALWSGAFVPPAITTIYTDRRDTLWVGTAGGRLYRMRQGNLVSEIKPIPGAEMISALFEDAETNLWIGYTGGAGVGVLPNGDAAKWRTIDGMPFPDVRSIAQAADGALWFGTHYGGACRLKDGRWTQFTTRDGLPSDYVRCLFADPDGTIWLGTLHGLCRWRDGKFVAITTEHGLWNDSLSHITEDGAGDFWMSSFGGVFRVKRQVLNDFADGKRDSIQCVGYNHNDGLPSVECTGGFQPAGAKTPDGRLWFPTTSGLVSVSPTGIKENALPPPVWIEAVTIDGKATTVNQSTTEIKVPPGKRRFDFRFTALSFAAPGKIRFRHKLDGLDEDWSPAGEIRTVTYSFIPPGHYVFQVMACNNDGVWNSDGQSIQLIVEPFFWQTWWFKIGAAMVLVLAVAWSVRRVERWNARLRLERLEQQHAVERERTRIAKDIHDDLGANLTQIVFLSQRAEVASHDATEVERWIRMIPTTARRTIQSLDEIVWAINPKHDSLESLANYLSQFVHEYLTLAGLRCVLDVPTVLPAVPLSAEVRHNLVLTTREAVQNAVKHAAATEVRVALELDEHTLKIVVADNGSGFEPGRVAGSGNGLTNMRRRMEDLGGRLEIISQPGAGTTVRLFVPRNQLHGRVIGNGEHPARMI